MESLKKRRAKTIILLAAIWFAIAIPLPFLYNVPEEATPQLFTLIQIWSGRNMMDWFLYGVFGSAPANWPSIIMGLLVALACGQVLAWVYMLTHSGLSYSRSFVKAMLLLPSIVSLVMMVLSNNLVTAFGMMAVFAIVRFRNILRDTLDTTYILISLVIGMATGTQKFTSAVVGCGVICVTMLYLWYSSYGTRQRYDLILSLRWGRSTADLPHLARLLRRHCWKALLASQRTYALAQQPARIISWEWDVKTDVMRWSDKPGPFLGLEQAFRGATFKGFLECVHPDDCELVRKTARDSILKRGRDVSIEHRIELPDGTVRWVPTPAVSSATRRAGP